MAISAQVPGIQFRTMEACDIDGVTDIISKAFTQREPLTTCLGIPREKDFFETRAVCQLAARDGVSVVAVDTTSNKIIGVASSIIVNSNPEPLDIPTEVLKMYEPIYALIDKMQKVFHDSPTYKNNPGSKVISAMKLGVHPKYTGRGIGTKLRQATTDLAQSRGYHFVTAVATAPESQRIYQKLGFQQLYDLKYCDFEMKGNRPFAQLGTLSAELYYKKLF
ncbi:arylalkylamine N-acetyltransferase 1-like [Saccoglossus kowalevskii]|uniref:Uncharacterized protein LOC102804760 n=1 Tax=Saccoglossus kowalevskii TaxID=10224 RepID=A0ABM0LYC5_SACKO|nr:PREDICTED: uncharacterized protein LOC102804760 [Saccoglossus kowalevskii]